MTTNAKQEDALAIVQAALHSPIPTTPEDLNPAGDPVAMMAMVQESKRNATVHHYGAGHASQNVDEFSIESIEPIYDLSGNIKNDFIGRSQNGIVNINNKFKNTKYVVVSHNEEKFITPLTISNDLVTTETIAGDGGDYKFVVLNDKNIKHNFHEVGQPVGEDMSQAPIQTQDFSLSQHISPGKVASYLRSFDLNQYNNEAEFRSALKNQVLGQKEDLQRKSAYNIILSKKLQEDTNMLYNQNSWSNDPLKTNMYSSLMVHGTETSRYNIINLTMPARSSVELFTNEQYNLQSARQLNTRFHMGVSMDFSRPGGATREEVESWISVGMALKARHIEKANGKNGSKGRIANNAMPILYTSSAFAKYFMFQSKEVNGTPYQHREYTSNYDYIAEYFTVKIDDSVFGYSDMNAIQSGYPVAAIAFPKCYYRYAFTKDDSWTQRYNPNTFMLENNVLAEFVQRRAIDNNDTHGRGYIRTEMSSQECGFLANPFAFIQVNKI